MSNNFLIIGDFGRDCATLLEDMPSEGEARRWVKGYTKSGNFGGYRHITIIDIGFAPMMIVVEKFEANAAN